VSRSEHRGASWAGAGEAVVAAAQDRRRAPADPGEDWSSLRGAQELARRITRHWAAEGVRCHCRVESAGFGMFCVRSNFSPGRAGNGRDTANNAPEGRRP